MYRKQLLLQQTKVARKLMGAIAMLLVAALMLGTSTYAWMVMSVSPEARDIKTTISGNGCLEIALQSPSGQGSMSRADITSGLGDSLLTTKERNTKWGNIVELGTAYGLESISLYPSRLNVNPTNQSVSTDGYLSLPEFGADGRISRLQGATFLTYTPGDAASFTEGRTYGVNILGTVGEEISEDGTITYHYRRSMIRDEAAGYLEEYRTSLRTQMIELLESQQVGIFNLILQASKLISGSGELGSVAWTDDNVETGKTIITRMYSITRESEPSLKWALLALAVADNITYPQNDEEAMTALGTLYREFLTYPLEGGEKSIRGIAEANKEAAETNGETAVAQRYESLIDAVDSILRAESQLGQARTYIADPDTVSNAFLLIIDVQNTFLKNGSELESNGPGAGSPGSGQIHRIYEVVDPSVKLLGQPARGIYYNYVKKIYSDYLYFTGATPGPTTGLFSIMANLLGDYQATTKAYFNNSSKFYATQENSRWKQWTMYLRATGKNGTGASADEIGKNAVSKYNEAENRGVLGTVYDAIMQYDPGNAMISFSINKGDGSAYGYSVDLAFRASKDCDLLLAPDALDRVLGMDQQEAEDQGSDPKLMGGGSTATYTLSGDLIGAHGDVAKELMQNIYIVLTDTDSGAILGVVAADETEVVLEQGNAKLALFEPSISESGILSKGPRRTSNIVTPMTAEDPVYITAIVFLNGDTLPSGALAATQHPSLYGTINLQFACSEELTPMQYDGYIGG